MPARGGFGTGRNADGYMLWRGSPACKGGKSVSIRSRWMMRIACLAVLTCACLLILGPSPDPRSEPDPLTLDLAIDKTGPSRLLAAMRHELPGCEPPSMARHATDSGDPLWAGVCTTNGVFVGGTLDVQTGVFRALNTSPGPARVTATSPSQTFWTPGETGLRHAAPSAILSRARPVSSRKEGPWIPPGLPSQA